MSFELPKVAENRRERKKLQFWSCKVQNASQKPIPNRIMAILGDAPRLGVGVCTLKISQAIHLYVYVPPWGRQKAGFGAQPRDFDAMLAHLLVRCMRASSQQLQHLIPT